MSVLLTLHFLNAGYEAVSHTVVTQEKWNRMKELLQESKYAITLPEEAVQIEVITGEDLAERIEVSNRQEVIKAYYTMYESDNYCVGFDYFHYILKDTDEMERQELIKRRSKSRNTVPHARIALQKAGGLEKPSK